MAKRKPNEAVNEPSMNNLPPSTETSLYGANTQPQSDIQLRAQNEMAMLDQYQAQKKANELAPKKIGAKEVSEAANILRKYKEGKARLEAKIIANEQFWKLRQWNYTHSERDDEFKPATAWLWSCIQTRHADLMDSYPTCNFLARQEDDKAEAEKLSDIMPVIMEQNRYEETYSNLAWYLLKNGGCVQGVFWDGSKHNGLGDITIKKIDFLNLFWESGITDIQESENVFTTELVSNRILEQRYPQTKGHLTGKKLTLSKYLYDDNVDTDGKSVVVDWYYHTEYNGRKVLQYCKFVNDIVLYATENDTEQPMIQQIDPMTGLPLMIPSGEPMSVRGLYDHAMYPFVVQQLYPIEGSLCGYGLTDIGRDTQLQIDIMNKAITDNVVATASPRYFIRNDGALNEEEFTNINKTLIHVEGNVGEENIRPVDPPAFASYCVEELQNKINELKYITSNQDANNGVAPSGITAASAIAALQETAGKASRDANKTVHRAYRDICYMVLELVRQFYDTPRTFRIAPDSAMGEQFVAFDNSGIKPQPQMMGGQMNGLRLPEFDIEVTSEKANPYKKMEMNELALNFYNQGFFNPEMADQAIACLDMMDFTGKDDVIKKVQQNGTLLQMLAQFQQIALMLAQKYEPETAEQIAQMVMEQNGQSMPMADVPNLDGSKEEHPFVQRARAEARASTEAN